MSFVLLANDRKEYEAHWRLLLSPLLFIADARFTMSGSGETPRQLLQDVQDNIG
jgi:hypothetical protein